MRSFLALVVVIALPAASGCSPDRSAGERPVVAAHGEMYQGGTAQGAMDIDTLYSLPSLIGTSPGLAAWSGDEKWLAFAWNDEGRPFRDVWLYSADSGDLRRLTRHGDDAGAEPLHEGVSEIAWLGGAGGKLAYLLDGALYVADRTGRSERIARPHDGVRNLQAAPAGGYISYVAAGDGDGSSAAGGALWIAAVGDGTVGAAERLVESGRRDLFIESYEWSADGERVAFVRADDADVPDREIHYYADGGELQVDEVKRAFPGDQTTRRELGVVDVDDRTIQWLPLADDQYPIWGYGLSADGQRLFANTSNFVVKEHTIYVFDLASGEREVFYHFKDAGNVIPGWQAAWAPADDGLVILTDRDGYYHLYHQREAGGELRQLTSGAWEIASFEVDGAGRQIYFVANRSHPSERRVYRVPFGGGAVESLTEQPGTWAPTFSDNFARVALHFSNDTTPPELYVRDIASGDSSRVTDSPLPAFDTYTWARVRYPEFESHIDGRKLYGRLSVPPDFDPATRYPLIVGSIYANSVRNQWGGRTAHPTWGLDQYFVANGYLVLNVNVRGSWGHGKVFSQGLIRDYGGIDIEDIESGVRHLVAEGFVDPERVGIWGSSYGGLMTLMSLFKNPDVYAAGIAGAPATNVSHAFPSQMWVMGEPRGDDYPDRYRRQSALFQHDGLRDPLMIIHGTRDSVVLYSDTVALAEELIADGRLFELVTLPGASHAWDADTMEQTRFAFKKIIRFFDRHLGEPEKRR